MSVWDSITVDSRQLQGKEKKQYGSVADNPGPGLVKNIKSNDFGRMNNWILISFGYQDIIDETDVEHWREGWYW